MQYARKLRKGDKVAIVSLSSGMLGEELCSHNIEIGVKRLKEYGLEPVFMPNALKGIEYLQVHPQARAKDLKDAFQDNSIAGIICAIGGDDTYRLLPYLMEDEEFIKAVEEHPKLFTGFSDTTINHLMFYKLGLSTYYGPNFICDLGEIADEMLPYTKRAFESYLEGNESDEIISSDTWYEEREDFSRAAIGTERKTHKEERGFELLQGSEIFQGGLLGGCLESLYDILTNSRYEDEKEVCERYDLFPNKEEWIGKILFIETCEEKPTPELFEREVLLLKEKGVFDVVNGILVGKPQDEAYYQEYKDILIRVIIKDYQRLKKDEADRLAIGWDVKRELSKINYRIHTDAVKEFLITPILSPQEMAYTYASEADILNMALFGKTAAQWRNEKGIKGKTPNIRDFASAEELVVLINLEDTNADLIRQEVPKIERLKILREKAYRQLELLRKNQDTIEVLKKNLIEI